MIAAYQKGIKRAAGYYLAGVFVSLIFHFVWGWEHLNLMPRSVAVLMLSILVGIAWATLNITRLFCPVSRPQNLGELVVHSVIFTVAAVFVIVLRSS